MRSAVHVLVVGLILVVSGGLVVVMTAKAREAGGRMQCRNNLRLVGLSLHNYQDCERAFPQAAMPHPGLAPEKRLSWIVAIVPYVESNTLYSKMHKDKPWDAEENRFAALLPYRILHCPAYPERPPVSTLEPTHYVGVAGIGPDAITLPREDPRAGFFGYERKIRAEDIERGTSTVLVAAETAWASGSWTAAGPPTVRSVEPDNPPAAFGGTHRGGCMAVFADASVRYIDKAVGADVWEAMARLSGDGPGHPVGDE
jgi:hypothetical protein